MFAGANAAAIERVPLIRGEFRQAEGAATALATTCFSCGSDKLIMSGTSIVARDGVSLQRQCLHCGVSTIHNSSPTVSVKASSWRTHDTLLDVRVE